MGEFAGIVKILHQSVIGMPAKQSTRSQTLLVGESNTITCTILSGCSASRDVRVMLSHRHP